MKRYALKGVNDDESVCVVCGKVELKRVMWLVELDADGNQTGEPFHCGTTCGARLLGYTQSKISTKVKRFASDVWQKRETIRRKMEVELGYEVQMSLIPVGITYAERTAHAAYIEAKRIRAEAKAWADAQEIVIEL